jgi:hypothetical protein
MRVVTLAPALAAAALGMVCQPVIAQSPEHDRAVAGALAHMRTVLPPGTVALDTADLSERRTVLPRQTVINAAGLELVNGREVIRCPSPLDCDMGRYSGIVSLETVSVAGARATVVARGYSIIRSQGRAALVMQERRISLIREDGAWKVVSSVVTKES